MTSAAPSVPELAPLLAVLDALPEIVHVFDAEWRWLHVNPAAADWLRSRGRDPEAVFGRIVWDEFAIPEGAPSRAAALRAVREGREVLFEEQLAGREYETRIIPYGGGAVSLTRDVTRQRAEERRRTYLAEAGALIADAPTAADMLPRLVRLTTGLLADCAIAYTVDGTQLVRMAAAHADPAKETLLRDMESVAPLRSGDPLVARVFAGGRPVRITHRDLASLSISDEHARLARTLGLRSAVLVPLIERGQPVGLLVVAADGTGRRLLDEDTLHVLGEVARRAGLALAVENARRSAEAAAERTQRLQRAISALSVPMPRAAILDRLIEHVVEATHAYMGAVYEVDGDTGALVLLRHMGLTAAVAANNARLYPSTNAPVGDVARTHEPVFIETAATWRERYGGPPRRGGEPVDDGAWAALPLLHGDRLVGVLALGFDHARRFPPVDRAFLLSLATHCAQALERSRADDALRRSEERYRATFERAGVGIAHVDLEGRWRRVNQRLCEITGYAREQLFTMSFQDITHPDDLYADLEQAKRLADGEIDSYEMEKRYLRPDGSVVWIHLNVSIVRSDAGAPLYYLSVIEDIDRRKRAEAEAAQRQEALRLEQRRLRAVLDVLPAGVWIASADGRIVEANNAALEIWGGLTPRSQHAAANNNDYRAFWADGSPVGPGDWGLARALRGERTGPDEIVIEAPDGSRRTILKYGMPIRAENAVAGAVALSVDITDRKAAEQNLRRATDQLGILFRATSGLLAKERPAEVLDRIAGDLEDMIGVGVCFHYVVEEGGNGPVLRLENSLGVPDDVAARFRVLPFGSAVCGTVAHNRAPIVLEDVQSSADPIVSAIQPLGISAYACYPLMADERLLGTLSFGLRDRTRYDAHELSLLKAISEQLAMAIDRARSLESEHHARRLAEEASRAKSGFMATVSHELRTPLNAVIGYAGLLCEGVPEPIGPDALQQVERIRIAANHLRQLIEEVLTFSRLESGRERIVVERVSLDELVREVRAVAEPLAAASGLAFSIATPHGDPVLYTDPRKLRQILLNLIGNAVKFTDEGEVRLEVRRDGEDIIFAVADTGIGIAEENREKLFEPFWQADDSPTRRAQGTGLGLSISRRFVELLDGEITVTSRIGVGSTFSLRLPVQRAG